MTYISSKNKIETQETNCHKLCSQVRQLTGYNPLIGWSDLITDYTKMGYTVIAEYDQTNDDFVVILNVYNVDGSFYKEIIED